MFTANSTRLLRHASRTLARLMERENRSGSALTAENMSILRKSMKNFINRINARLSPRVVSDDQYLADLEALSELSKLSADQINSSVLAQEKELFQKYFREKGHYKLDLMEKYFNSYFSINVPDNNADQQTWDEYHSSINSFKSSLEGSHSSFVSHILEEVKKKEDEYISEISKYFDQVIAEQFASQMERVELCNRLKLPVKNYLSGSGKNIPDPAAGSSGRTEPYQTANLGNAKQQKFFQSSGAQNSSAGNNPQKEPSERKTGRDAGSQPGKQQKTKNRYDELTDRMMDDYHNGRPYQNSEQEKRDSNGSSAPPSTPAPPKSAGEFCNYSSSTSSILKFSSLPAISWLASKVMVVSVFSATSTGTGCPKRFCRNTRWPASTFSAPGIWANKGMESAATADAAKLMTDFLFMEKGPPGQVFS